MKLHELLPYAGLPALVFVGLGAGVAVAGLGSDESEIPPELAAAPHCRVADIPAQAMSPEAMKAYEDAQPPLWTDLGTLSVPVTTKNPEPPSSVQSPSTNVNIGLFTESFTVVPDLKYRPVDSAFDCKLLR